MRIYEYKGSWYYVFDVEKHPVTGKRRQYKKGGFKTQKAAEKAGVKAQVDVKSGLVSVTEKITFGEMAHIWFNEYKNNGMVKRTSVSSREYILKVLFRFFNQIQISKLNMTIIQHAINEIANRYSRVYTSEIFTVLRMVLKKAKQLGVLNADPSEFVYVPKQKKSLEEVESEPIENKYLERNTLKKFLDTARDYGLDYDFIFFKTLAYTGMRIGELLALKWSDIDLEEMTISVNRRISHEKNNLNDFELDTPKTKSSKRTIPVEQSLITGLKELRTQQHWFRSKHSETVDFGFVFINLKTKKGYPQTQKFTMFRLKRLLKIADIKQYVTPHTFRHTHTSLMAEAGVDLNTIMERLGHKNDSITRDIYLHITKTLKQEAVLKFSKLMNDESNVTNP